MATKDNCNTQITVPRSGGLIQQHSQRQEGSLHQHLHQSWQERRKICTDAAQRSEMGRRCAPSTFDLDQKKTTPYIQVKDQPTGYDWLAPLLSGATNISTKLYWQPAEQVLLGHEPSLRQRKSRVTFVLKNKSSFPD